MCSLFYKLKADVMCTSRFQISCISVVTILLMLMHEGCCTIKCGSMTCRNYDGTCDGGRILEKEYKLVRFTNILIGYRDDW